MSRVTHADFLIPGGIELMVILFVVVFNLLLVAAVIVGVIYLIRRLGRRDERNRIEELERRVEELESEGE